MSESEWLRACAERFMEKGVRSEKIAIYCAQRCFENLGKDCGYSPIEAADEDMSRWSERHDD